MTQINPDAAPSPQRLADSHRLPWHRPYCRRIAAREAEIGPTNHAVDGHFTGS
ncbi:MAG: hypothetical protein WDN03_15445 [Rhizomicrobium sp.]